MNTSSIAYLLSQSFAWALLYSLAQGLIIYIFLYTLLRAIGGVSARIKYYITTCSFAIVFFWFAGTFLHQYNKLSNAFQQLKVNSVDTIHNSQYPSATSASYYIEQSAWYHSFIRTINTHSSSVINLYLFGLVLMLGRFIAGLNQTRKLKADSTPLYDTFWNKKLQYWRKELAISRPVKILLSARVLSPVMLGYAKPIILLPIATFSQLSMDQVESILLHEMAHIKRHDYLINILQIAGETLLFFNPFVWLISSLIREQREHCCDDIVIANSTNPLPYANALAILETNRYNQQFSLAATGNKNQLLNRIKRIMEMKKTNTNYGQLSLIIIALIAITFSLAMINPSFAQKVKKTITKTTTVDPDSSPSKNAGYVKVDSTSTRKTIKIAAKSSDEKDNVDIDISIGNDDMEGAIAIAANGHTIIKKELREVAKELESVDWQSIKDEINKSLAEVEKELNSSQFKKDISIKISKGLEEAKVELENAKNELASKRVAITVSDDGEVATENIRPDYETMLNEMTKDGLIDRDTKYKIKKEGGILYINGKEQPQSVVNKYKAYLDAEKIKITGNKGSLNISIEK